MPTQEVGKIGISRSNYHGVFIPAVFPRKKFLNITQKLYNELLLKCEPSFFVTPSYNDNSPDKLVGCFASVSTERYFKKMSDYNSLTESEKEELEWAYSDKILTICQEICNEYNIDLLYKAHLLFPVQGRTFLNYKITPDN